MIDEHMRQCDPGEFPWDDWKQKALDAGVPADLAQPGRNTMREAYNHSWDAKPQAECAGPVPWHRRDWSNRHFDNE